MKTLLIFVAGLLIITGSCGIKHQKALDKREINEDIQALITIGSAGPFSGSLLVAQDGEIFVQQNYGFIDFEKSASITNQSRFNIGSAAKEVSSVAILDLIERGKLDYADPVNEYLDYLPKWAEKVTIRDLLYYKSGLPPVDFLKTKTDELAIKELQRLDALTFEPGTDYLYSNWNNFLQAKIVESIVGMDFPSWVKQQFFDPLGMQGAFYGSTLPSVTENITKAFSQHYGDDVANHPNFKIFELCYAPLYMTPEDLFKWVEYVSRKYQEGGKAIAPFFQATTIEQQGPVGVIKKEGDQVTTHIHGGGSYSFETLIYRDYQKDFTIIMMSNDGYSNDLDKLRDNILEIIDRHDQ